MKRVLYLVLIVAVIIAVVLVAYFLSVWKGGTTPGGENGGTGQLPGGQLPPGGGNGGAGSSTTGGEDNPPLFTAEEKFGVLAQISVNNYFVNEDDSVLVVQPNGLMVKVANGEATILSADQIENLIESSFSYDGKKALVAYGDLRTPRYKVFDINTRKWQELPQEARSPAWSPNDYRVAYFFKDASRSALETLDFATSTKPKEVLKMRQEDTLITWFAPTQMLFTQKPSSFALSSAWIFDTQKKTLVPLIKDKLGLEVLWNYAADKGIAFAANQNSAGGKLSLIDGKGNTLKNILFLTLPEKCSFETKWESVPPTPSSSTSTVLASKNFLYCAIPKDPGLFPRTQLPDAYQKRAVFTVDVLYRTELEGGGKTISISPNPARTFDAYMLRAANNKLYFINRYDQKLYTTIIPQEESQSQNGD